MVATDHAEDRPADEADRLLAKQIVLVHDEVDAAVAAYRESVRRDVFAELGPIVRRAADAHAAVLADLNGAETTVDQIRRYRAGLHAEVVAPLADRLVNVDPAASLASAHAGLLDTLSSIADALEEEIVCLEPEALYMPTASDNRLRRWRKQRVRLFRSAKEVRVKTGNMIRRLVRGPARTVEPPRRCIPLRRLADYHVKVRVPLEIKSEHAALCGIVGEAVADVGRCVTEHVHAVLSSEAPASRDKSSSTRQSDEPAPVGAAGPQDSAGQFDAALRGIADRLAAHPDSEAAASVPRSGLERDVFESGTFMLDLDNRGVERAGPLRQYAAERDRQWNVWHQFVRSRIALMARLLELRGTVVRLDTNLTTRALDECVHPARQVLAGVEKALNRLSVDVNEDFDRGVAADDVRRHLRNALQVVDTGLVIPLRERRYGETIRKICDEAASELSAVVQRLPEIVEVNMLEEPEPEHGPRRVELREHAERAFDALLIERLREEADHLARGLTAAREEAESLPGILRFNLGTAIEDLEGDAPARTEVRELVVDGLSRSAGVLTAAGKGLDERAETFRQRISDIFETGFTSLHRRLQVEDRVREQMLDFRSDAEAGFRRVAERASRVVRRADAGARKVYRAGVQRSAQWIRIGRQAAGLATITEEERFATLDVLIDTERLLDNLPLVYRRLFSFDPIRDPSMLEGRRRELQSVQQHVDRWRRGLTNTLVLTGTHGSGHTSFLNVLRQTVLEGADVHTLDLDRRLRTEDDLVQMLSAALKLEDSPASSFDVLAEQLIAREATGRLQVCLVEHLEHVFLRQVGGTELAQRFLTFLSRTDSRMVWMVTVSDYGWQLIRKAEPTASRLAVVQTLLPVTRDGLETIILNRHRRSGLPLHFEAPATDTNPLLARRLRRARSEQDRQNVIRAEFFDRLYRACEHHIMLALLYWLRSTEMDADAGVIRVRFVEPLSFAFLETLDMDQAFTLKAMLEHASLTVEEHSELFLLPMSGSLEHFEALGNLLLIEPMERDRMQSRFAFATVETGVRYRIRPLLIHTVIQYLRSRNVLH